MPVMHKLSSSRVVMYAGDHLLAHVHIQLRDGRECTVELDSLAIVGRIALREIREELLWIASNRVWLHEEWLRLNP
jgi:ribosomal protein L2